MSEITLSKAVRSNLLNLQSTAELLGKSQERLSTGLRVNSALDNPTNFFTAQGLNSRANDLNQLLDSVSNAVQTVAAADKGITAITKLVESAQATARQALQTANQVSTTAAAEAGVVTGGAFTTLNVSATAGSPSPGTFSAGAFTTVDVSGTASGPTAGSIVGGAFSNINFENGGGNDGSISFDLSVDGGAAQTVTIDYAAANAGAADASAVTAAEMVDLINDAANTALGTTGQTYASVNGSGGIDIASNTSGGSSSVAITNFAATNGATGSGLANGTDTGDAAVAADSLSFTVTLDGGAPQSVTLSAAAVTQYNNDNGTSFNANALTAANVAAMINDQVGATVATVNGSGGLDFTSVTSGATSSVAVSAVTPAGTPTGSTGITANSDTGAAAGVADAVTFSLTRDGGTAQTITISAASVTAYNTANSGSLSASSLSAANVASIINYQAGATVASVTSGGALQLSSTTTGAASSVAVSSFSSTVSGGSTGIANGSDTGANATTTTTVNPKRAELVDTYNDLLTQIDQLAKDAGFNGVNLLNGDNLSVLFNEDGSSSLDISGVTNSAAGLGLTALGATAFDTNSSINSTLDGLKGAIDTLRTQSGKFGSNLSVVQTRQDFTKQMINVLQTGASNLTLADTNEEAANVLALQTRQQLSSTALSLASQADQNVLRLF